MDTLLAIAFLFIIIGYWLLVPYEIKEFVNNTTLKLSALGFDLLQAFAVFVEVTMVITHYFGKIVTVILMAGSIVLVTNEVLSIYGVAFLSNNSDYQAWLTAFSKPHFLAGASTVVATTVAISHIRKLSLDEFESRRKAKEAR